MSLAETSLSAAMTRAGLYGRNEAQLRVDLARYLNRGGTPERLLQIVLEIQQLSGGGHRFRAPEEGHHRSATPGQPNGGGGARQALSKDHTASAPSSPPQANRPGHDAFDGQSRSPLPAPVREPSPGARAAAARVAQSIVITVFDRVKTSDGRPWGNVGAHELDGMTRDGAVANAVKEKLGPLSNRQRFQTLRQLMTPPEFELITESTNRAAREAANVS